MKHEFEEFFGGPEVLPPQEVTRKILEQAHSYLNPPLSRVFLKLLIFHLVSSLLSLSICPQFGIGPFGGGDGMLGWIMQYGHLVCAIFCGSVYLGFTATLAIFGMRMEELQVVGRSAFWQFTAMAVFSWASFMALGGSPESVLYSLSWILAGSLSATLLVKVLCPTPQNN